MVEMENSVKNELHSPRSHFIVNKSKKTKTKKIPIEQNGLREIVQRLHEKERQGKNIYNKLTHTLALIVMQSI